MTQKFQTFRSVFKNVDKELLHWFPGHMGRGLKQMQQKLRSVDCIVEVHDARIPFSGRNEEFKYTVSGLKPHILVMNKVDLVEEKYKKPLLEKLKQENEHVIFTNCKDQKNNGVKQIFPLAKKLIENSNRYNRSNENDYCMMVIGIPNVGKSSLINALRIRHLHKGKASHVGASPGITRNVLEKIKISQSPLFYLLDTPGILSPSIKDIETGLKLALCNTIHEHLVGQNVIADYLLYWLNKHEKFTYVDYFNLEKPTDDILEVLTEICKNSKKVLKVRNHLNEYVLKPDFDSAAKLMIKAFREGHLGNILLDQDFINC